MKKYIYLLVWLSVLCFSFAQTTMGAVEEYLQRGVFEYQNNNFSQALDNFLLAENSGVKNPDLYYNIGNSYYMLNDKPRAIVYYKRALLMDSAHQPAQKNLEYVLSLTTDSQSSEEENLLGSLIEKAFYFLSINTLLLVFLGLFLVFILLIHIQWRSVNTDTTMLRFVNFIVLFILLFFAGVVCARVFLVNDNEGVITENTVYVYSGPSESFTRLFTIHEGTVLKIKQQQDNGWTQMTTTSGWSGWIKTESFLAVRS